MSECTGFRFSPQGDLFIPNITSHFIEFVKAGTPAEQLMRIWQTGQAYAGRYRCVLALARFAPLAFLLDILRVDGTCVRRMRLVKDKVLHAARKNPDPRVRNFLRLSIDIGGL